MIRQPRHLREVTHRHFRHVRLPVGVRRERRRRIERQVCRHRGQLLRIPRHPLLHAFHRVQQRHGNAAEKQHRNCVFRPTHFPPFVHAGHLIEQSLQGTQQGIQKCFLARKYARHEDAQRLRHRKRHQQKQKYLQPPIRRHGQNLSGHNNAATKYPKIKTQITSRKILPSIEPHSSLQSVTPAHISQSHQKKSQSHRQKRNVAHYLNSRHEVRTQSLRALRIISVPSVLKPFILTSITTNTSPPSTLSLRTLRLCGESVASLLATLRISRGSTCR